MSRGELVLHFQPIVELRSRRPVAAEALLRWRRAGDLAAPGAFWANTDTACAQEIGQFVLDSACQRLAGWRAEGLCPEMSVNVDPRELTRSWLASVYDALDRYQLPPSTLNVELTETSQIDPVVGADVAAALIRRGVGVALDDAGTGFNALAAVSDLPLTELKIDRSFVSRLGDPRADALVRGLVAISQELGMRSVAEGVETEQQAQILEGYGVQRAQGYLFSRPVAAPEFADYWRQAHGDDVGAVELIREMAAIGASPATTAAILNRRGTPGPNGRSWRAGSVSRVLLAQPVAPCGRRRA